MMKNGFLAVGSDELAALFPKLPDRINKGDMGRVLLVCGSYDPSGLSMCGAAFFAAKAAYRCGAGIVEIFTPRENYSALAALAPEAVFSLYGYEESCEAVTARVKSAAAKCDAVVIGCGLGRSLTSKMIVRAVLESASCPLVIDADGLNTLAEYEGIWSALSKEQRGRTVITPHPGEMARLCGLTVDEILSDTVSVSRDFAEKKGIICLLKDHNTVVSDGETVYINQSGNAGMATAGMGDVLAGVIGALLARNKKSKGLIGKEDALLCAAAAAYLHGRAGDLAAAKIGQYSLNSSDLLSEIPSAIGEIFG